MRKILPERTSPKILLFLATRGESNKWKIAKGVNRSYSNIHAVIKLFLKEKFILVVKKRKARRNLKLNVEYYDLTIYGLVVCLLLDSKEVWTYIDEIAEAQKNRLPLIFGKWSYFKEKSILDEVVERLKIAVLQLSTDKSMKALRYLADLEQRSSILRVLSENEELKKDAFSDLRIAFLNIRDEYLPLAQSSEKQANIDGAIAKAVFLCPDRTDQQQLNFLKAIGDDRELSELCTLLLKEMEKFAEMYLSQVREWKRVWHEIIGIP